METTKTKTRKIILITVAVLIIGVIAAKQLLKIEPSVEGPATIASTTGSAVYLFLNEEDQDAGCRRIYSLYEDAKQTLSTNVKTGRLDVNGDQTLFDKFDVRILPTVLFIGANGEVKQRIEGEGSAVEIKLKEAFKNFVAN